MLLGTRTVPSSVRSTVAAVSIDSILPRTSPTLMTSFDSDRPSPARSRTRATPRCSATCRPHALERAARERPQERRHQEADDEQDQRAAQARKEAAQLFLGVVQQGDRESAHGLRDPPSRLASP